MSVSAASLFGPTRIAFDCFGNLWVSDEGNNRVLMYEADRRKPDLFYSGQLASLVLGQPSFVSNGAPDPPTATSLSHPAGIGFDGCNLWVADAGNNRVLMYEADRRKPDLFYSGQLASLVLGQPNFTSSSAPSFAYLPPRGNNTPQDPLNAKVLPSPNGIAFDSDRNLWIAQWTRVLRFSSLVHQNQQPSSLVIGKPNFVAADVHIDPSIPTPTERLIYSASDVAFDQSGNLWVADNNDERILRYSADPNHPDADPNHPDLFSNGQAASLVLGAPDFNSRPTGDHLTSPVTASTIWAPQAIAFDAVGNLWASDLGFNRILRYSPPFSVNGQAASLVLGHSNFDTRDSGPPSATSLNFPSGIAFDHTGNLWVADSNNNRILRYSPPFSVNGQAASLVLGKQNFNS